MIRRPPRSTHCISSAASDVYKRQEKQRIRELDLVLAKKTQQYKKLRDNREQREEKEQESLDESSISQISQSSKSTYSKTGGRVRSGKKTFITHVKNSSKPSEGVNIYKPNISCSRKALKPTSATPSKKVVLPENTDLDPDALSCLSKEEQTRLNQLMIEYKEVIETPQKEETVQEAPEVGRTPSSILSAETVSRVDEIDDALRQLVPIDRWEEWSLNTSIRSVTADSLLTESAPSRLGEGDASLKSFSLKSKYKKAKPKDKFLKEMAEKRETKTLMKEIDQRISALWREHMRLKGVVTEDEKIVKLRLNFPRGCRKSMNG
eukprot:TRINITY_DN13805_c0_g2_i1.p1 TRINITY_DN13805_c0_g2~~TRINITY_DN13805_c0_g2_i1.p1  ORF type:complete len:330 (+),score=105.68 TRINITY_DN13805_c0_g2_i1:28-990(+)